MIIIYNIENPANRKTLMSSANTTQPCRHIELVRSQVAEIAMCPDCKVVHITLQHVTIRLTADAFQELVWSVVKAQSLIDRNFSEHHSEQPKTAHQKLRNSDEATTLDRVLANFEAPVSDKFH
jgi:hypothetical protein